MSVLSSISIVPKSDNLVQLGDIIKFITYLSSNLHIEKDIEILTGPANEIAGLNSWQFKRVAFPSVLGESSKLEILNENNFDALSNSNNYGFIIHLSKNSTIFKNLDVFRSDKVISFPLFISYLASPINYEQYYMNEDIGEENFDEEFDAYSISKTISNINLVIQSDGRNSYCLLDLVEKKEQFDAFYNDIRQFFGEFEAGYFVEC